MKFSYHSKLLPAVAFATARRPHDAPACPQVHERSKQTKIGLKNKTNLPPSNIKHQTNLEIVLMFQWIRFRETFTGNPILSRCSRENPGFL